MTETNSQEGKYIFTDTLRTKDILWDAYIGFIENYHDYKMMIGLFRVDPVILAAVNKYAFYFYDEIRDFIPDFKIENQKEVEKIFKKKSLEIEDYEIVRIFFGTFMKVSGIKNIVKEKDVAGDSILENR